MAKVKRTKTPLVKLDVAKAILFNKKFIGKFDNSVKKLLDDIGGDFIIEARNVIRRTIAASRRTGRLESRFIKYPQHSGGNIIVVVENIAPYAAFIDSADINSTVLRSDNISASNIQSDSQLLSWFRNKSDFYRVHGRLPSTASIGRARGTFGNYSIFSTNPQGIKFMDRAGTKVVQKYNETVVSSRINKLLSLK